MIENYEMIASKTYVRDTVQQRKMETMREGWFSITWVRKGFLS